MAHLIGIHHLLPYIPDLSSSPILRASSALTIPVLINSVMFGKRFVRRDEFRRMQSMQASSRYLITVLRMILARTLSAPGAPSSSPLRYMARVSGHGNLLNCSHHLLTTRDTQKPRRKVMGTPEIQSRSFLSQRKIKSRNKQKKNK